MERAEQIRILKGLMTHLDNDTTVDAGGHMRNPVSSYTDATLAEQEWQSFFQNYPQVLGLSGDLVGPGSFFTSHDLGRPILCTRNLEGEFRAFLNVCRHRGAPLVEACRGQTQLFSCPFHAWGYNPNGELVAVPKEAHFGRVDREAARLIELPAVERHGILWVMANPEGTFDIDDLLGELGDELASWKLDKAEYNSSTRFDTAMNYKLATDTFGETYHFNRLHQNTLANGFYGNVAMYDTFKLNHRLILCMRSIDELRDKPEADWHVLQAVLADYYLFPNIQLLITATGPTLIRIYPKGTDPDASYTEISYYAHEALFREVHGPEASMQGLEERMQNIAAVIQAEDYRVAAGCHLAAQAGDTEYVTYGRNEPALHHYHNAYRRVLGQPPLDVIPVADPVAGAVAE